MSDDPVLNKSTRNKRNNTPNEAKIKVNMLHFEDMSIWPTIIRMFMVTETTKYRPAEKCPSINLMIIIFSTAPPITPMVPRVSFGNLSKMSANA